ncbi:hypothetical protein D1AOALGA4SA_2730 [Olavius algarvensis Delta 1 endosymbiont]|nr:hypothetical protein D1AOALGA4SA_2730 [Olavius algarvensis Delta 1 endosymbiont]
MSGILRILINKISKVNRLQPFNREPVSDPFRLYKTMVIGTVHSRVPTNP